MSAESLLVTWSGGTSRARIILLDDDRVSLLSGRAFAPGSRPEGVLGGGGPLRMKTARCRLATDAERDGVTLPWPAEGNAVFLLEGRLLDASRALRTSLTNALLPVVTPSEPEPELSS